MRDPEQLKRRLKEYGRQVGLDLIGVASATPFLIEQAHLQRRAAAGHGPVPFEWQQIEPRVYPDLVLPGAKSIIAAGLSYLIDDAPSATGDTLRGWLSRYCRGQDYHRILQERLQQVADWLREQVAGCRTQIYVDTGPPLERAVAERAGIGKFGKHTNLITPRFGTWVFLGEILTDLALPPDEPVEAACGACTLCIEACPTQCLTEWHLDAWRCLSYVTQMKGIVPLEFRATMGNRLFGCDDCQDVCPYNKKAQRGGHRAFAPTAELGAEPDLLTLLRMTQGDFRRWFGPTAAGWRGKSTIQRNALIALGNAGDPRALPALVEKLTCESHVLRAHAAWALTRLARTAPEITAAVKEALIRQRAQEAHAAVLLEIDNGLEALTDAVSR